MRATALALLVAALFAAPAVSALPTGGASGAPLSAPAPAPKHLPDWSSWSRDVDADRLDDELEYWLRTRGDETLPVIICWNRMPGAPEARAVEALGGRVGYVSSFIPVLTAQLPRDKVASALELPGVARIEADVPLEPSLDTSVPSIRVDEVWRDYGLRGEGVTVCVVDTGIDGNHTSLDDLDDIASTDDPKIVAFYDAASSPEVTDGSTPPFDADGHGTHVAAVAAGTGMGSPAGRFIGVAPGAKLVGVKILANGSTDMVSSDAIRGIEWAMANRDNYGIRVLSMSFGAKFTAPFLTNDGTSALSQLCNRAAAEGLVCVASAGNSGPMPRSISPPGDARDVITVGNVRDDHTLNPTSSRGPVGRLTNTYVKPDVCAPGTDIYSAEANSGDRFVAATGTSDSCPHVSGLVALMIQALPDLRPSDVMSILHSTAEPRATLPWQSSPNNDYGWGVVDAVRAIENCTSGTLPPVVFINPLERANGTVLLTGTASSARGTVQSVEVRIDSGPYELATGTTSWSYVWNTSAHTNGPHLVGARAFDGSVHSYEYRIIVEVDNLLVAISPIEPGLVIRGEFTFTGSADGSGIQSVEVRVDERPWEPVEDMANRTFKLWRYRVNTTRLANGKHVLEARAFDGSKYSPLSSLEFSVDNPGRSPLGPAEGLLPGFDAVVLGLAAALALVLVRRGRAWTPKRPC
ncbi:MAG: S8 family serine peptidase [Thermoplasmatota archaeon]